MEYNEFINQIAEKYGYQDNLKRAIEIAIPLMINKYGESRKEEVLNVFRDVRIFSFKERTKETFDNIQKQMEQDINRHLKDTTKADYGNDNVPGSSYTYQAIYNEEMQIIGEKRWICIEEINDRNKKIYEEVFGTNINIPYLLHELGHAFAMQNPTYNQEGNKIYSKHGMYETVDEIKYENGVPTVTTIKEEGLLVEDVINEKMTKDQLMDFFGINDVDELKPVLTKLTRSGNIYGGSLHLLAEQLEMRLGTENVLKWRVENDKQVKENFSSLCNATEIASVYFPGEDAYSFFATKVHNIYQNNTLAQNLKISIEEYGKLNKIALYDAMAVICAYREAIGERDFAFYDEQRKEAFPETKTEQSKPKSL